MDCDCALSLQFLAANLDKPLVVRDQKCQGLNCNHGWNRHTPDSTGQFSLSFYFHCGSCLPAPAVTIQQSIVADSEGCVCCCSRALLLVPQCCVCLSNKLLSPLAAFSLAAMAVSFLVVKQLRSQKVTWYVLAKSLGSLCFVQLVSHHCVFTKWAHATRLFGGKPQECAFDEGAWFAKPERTPGPQAPRITTATTAKFNDKERAAFMAKYKACMHPV